ncbi:MAG: dihydrofolate reductase [Clostridiaceae bacterium]|nr:dihydrofolate reductase [Clostridiaceae bacterium]
MRKDLILIASADKNWGLGKDNKLLVRIPEDLKRFAGFTKGNMIIVGRKTLESFKDKKPLPDRINVVLTRDRTYECEGAVIVHDLNDLEKAVEGYKGDVYVCGGQSIYTLLLPFCSKALITRIDAEYDADTRLVNLDSHPEWEKVSEEPWQVSSTGVRFKYVEYQVKENDGNTKAED